MQAALSSLCLLLLFLLSYAQISEPTVRTTSGQLKGFVSPDELSVNKFLGIPFARPPKEELRFAPPQPFKSSKDPIIAKAIGPSCPQLPVTSQGVSVYTPSSGNRTELFPPAPYTFSEDCLTLNVWAPSGAARKNASLPVIVWFFGGGFTAGGADALYYDPTSWVARTAEHIVVSVNFRSNIFGFPNSAELKDQNLGLLDQRLSLEWIRDNIKAFGGDSTRIGLWGQSAGGIAIDYLNFAYPSDPIASAYYLHSGVAVFPPLIAQSPDSGHTQFATIANAVGCGLAQSQLACMRTKPWQDIENALSFSTTAFRPVPDEKLVFGDYRSRYAAGKLSSVPAIVGSAQHELNALVPHLVNGPLNETASDLLTNQTFLCAAASTSTLRQAAGRKTFRFRYDGDFPNISPQEYPGAWHASELPLLFGTSGKFHGLDTPFETATSMRMQDLWLAFVADPESFEGAGWPEYASGQAILLGSGDKTVNTVAVKDLDAPCSSIAGISLSGLLRELNIGAIPL